MGTSPLDPNTAALYLTKPTGAGPLQPRPEANLPTSPAATTTPPAPTDSTQISTDSVKPTAMGALSICDADTEGGDFISPKCDDTAPNTTKTVPVFVTDSQNFVKMFQAIYDILNDFPDAGGDTPLALKSLKQEQQALLIGAGVVADSITPKELLQLRGQLENSLRRSIHGNLNPNESLGFLDVKKAEGFFSHQIDLDFSHFFGLLERMVQSGKVSVEGLRPQELNALAALNISANSSFSRILDAYLNLKDVIEFSYSNNTFIKERSDIKLGALTSPSYEEGIGAGGKAFQLDFDTVETRLGQTLTANTREAQVANKILEGCVGDMSQAIREKKYGLSDKTEDVLDFMDIKDMSSKERTSLLFMIAAVQSPDSLIKLSDLLKKIMAGGGTPLTEIEKALLEKFELHVNEQGQLLDADNQNVNQSKMTDWIASIKILAHPSPALKENMQAAYDVLKQNSKVQGILKQVAAIEAKIAELEQHLKQNQSDTDDTQKEVDDWTRMDDQDPDQLSLSPAEEKNHGFRVVKDAQGHPRYFIGDKQVSKSDLVAFIKQKRQEARERLQALKDQKQELEQAKQAETDHLKKETQRLKEETLLLALLEKQRNETLAQNQGQMTDAERALFQSWNQSIAKQTAATLQQSQTKLSEWAQKLGMPELTVSKTDLIGLSSKQSKSPFNANTAKRTFTAPQTATTTAARYLHEQDQDTVRQWQQTQIQKSIEEKVQAQMQTQKHHEKTKVQQTLAQKRYQMDQKIMRDLAQKKEPVDP